MELMRSTWTDSRLDDLNVRVEKIDVRVEKISSDLLDVRSDLREMRGEIGTLQRMIMQVGGGLIGTLIVALLGLVATQL
jgi:chaperonin cofactor prefoldin